MAVPRTAVPMVAPLTVEPMAVELTVAAMAVRRCSPMAHSTLILLPAK